MNIKTIGLDLFGPTLQVAAAGVSSIDGPLLPARLMVGLLYLNMPLGMRLSRCLKHSMLLGH